MPVVAVRHLRLTGRPGRTAALRRHVEDALRLSAPDDPRLLILRRLDLGRLPGAARAEDWTRRTRERLSDQRARAVHATHPGAASADAVWFRSIEEARTVLLLLLASGRSADAWFWRLALPAERDAALGAFLMHWATQAARDEAVAVALARAVVAAARAGVLPAIVAAVPPAAQPGASARTAEGRVAVAVGQRPHDPAQVVALTARLDARVRQALVAVIAALPAGDIAAEWVARMMVLAAAPELVRHPAKLSAVASALIAAHRASPSRPVPVGQPDRMVMSLAAPAGVDATPAVDDVTPMADAPVAHHHRMATQRQAAARSASTLPDADSEQASGAAGVMLAIRALDRLGLGARLAADGDLALAGFGRGLLCHIAARARTPPDDPLFAALDAPAPDFSAMALHAWRRGLDRWLRRRAGLRLADLAGRRGWLLHAGSALHVRLPVNAADLRLRRRALDADPGWVPWLGLSVRYHFSDTPLQ